ncbi:hypothetical protein G7077_10045 [Sphingomonas piscis]|uniref:Uncharacterized protein n=1 Tax=Sphingomonas piscis TaxID=2714943 RepID=A0A6G7YR15_9SPHN|nr:hypothetical protein [Sphingomonas piscis]QIK79185.1 hypothetical protein G7077_10045 [Sphingomonas piscis]
MLAGIVRAALVAMMGWVVIRAWLDPSKRDRTPPTGGPDTGPDGFDW